MCLVGRYTLLNSASTALWHGKNMYIIIIYYNLLLLLLLLILWWSCEEDMLTGSHLPSQPAAGKTYLPLCVFNYFVEPQQNTCNFVWLDVGSSETTLCCTAWWN